GVAAMPHTLADAILTGPVALHDRLIDDHDTIGGVEVPDVEGAAAQDRRPDRIEVVGRDIADVRHRHRLAGRWLGVVLGGVAAWFASRSLSDLLYETSARDPVVYVEAAAVLALAAVVASVVPARRSTAVDPVQAIRVE